VADQTMSVNIRRAEAIDADDIADAHLDSIRSIGSRFYSADIVAEWGSRVAGSLYLNAMEGGEVFFIAIGSAGEPQVLGFSSHRVDDGEHRTAVYVRGSAARQGVGSALFRAAEADAAAAGAPSIHVDASLAAVDFYLENGFVEIGKGQHPIGINLLMPCVFMRKDLLTP
jgi:GNAT superfamily N-acetyltransferase